MDIEKIKIIVPPYEASQDLRALTIAEINLLGISLPEAYSALGPTDRLSIRSVSLAAAETPQIQKAWIDLVVQALSKKEVDPEAFQLLDKVGLIGVTTRFRLEELYPGEVALMPYQFEALGHEFAGFLGFDADHQLVTIDERWPLRRSFLRGEADWAPVADSLHYSGRVFAGSPSF